MAADPRLIAHLSTFVTERRRERMEAVLSERTRFLTVVLEDLYQYHNASAVLRSCDGVGVQDVHIIENRNRYQVNPDIALGSSQWLTQHRYGRADADTEDAGGDPAGNTREAYRALRARGYRIIATAPRRGDIDLEQFPVEEAPTALVFGNELDGLTETALEEADGYLRIPMRGFVDSFNISVSAALCMHFLMHRLRQTAVEWRLSEEEKQELRLAWLRRSIRRVERIERSFADADEPGSGPIDERED